MGTESEVWKDVYHPTNDLSLYEVSNMGDVRNKKTKHVLSTHISKGYGTYSYVSLAHKPDKTRDFRVSRLVALVFCENSEDKPYVDHINRDPTDDRAENLRWVTPRENAANQGPSKGRKYKGVYAQKHDHFDKKPQGEFEFMRPPHKYLAKCGGVDLGTFNSEEEAAGAYDKKAKETWGDYAVLNNEN